MAKSHREAVTRAFALVLFVGFAVAALLVQRALPFWQAWDMDLITAVDLLRLGSGLIPQHINHTGFGMYLPLHAAWELSPLVIMDLGSWLATSVPLYPLADIISWLRLLTTFAGTVLVMATWSAMPRLALVALLVTLPSLWLTPLLVVRTELWAVMWYALAFATIAHARSTRAVCAGFFLAGLGFITKYQGLFLHAGLVLLVFQRFPPAQWPRLPRRAPALAVLGVFFLLGFCSFLSYVPNQFATFSKATAPNVFFLTGLAILCLPLLRTPWARFGGPAWWAVAGVMAVFPLHFFMGLDFSVAWEYLVFDWRMLFVRISKPAIAAARADNILLWSLQHHAGLLLLWTALAIRHWRRANSGARIFVGLYAALILVSLRLVTRGHIQDAMWNDFLILFGLLPLLEGLPRRWEWALVPLIVLQVYQLRGLRDPTQLMVGQRDLDRYWREPYESPDLRYTEIMSQLESRRAEINAHAAELKRQ
jgi:hypothetical protein